MRIEDFTGITDRCFYGDPASCSFPCPFSFDVRTFLERAKSGKWKLAYKLLRNAVTFPAIVCELCPAPCMGECQRAHVGDEPVAIKDIESACIRFSKKKDPESFRIPPKEERIAVVGAGLAGLSCALILAQKKYSVTVFEKTSSMLSSLADHPKIANFREEIEFQFSAVTIDFNYEVEIKSLSALNDFSAVYIATGNNDDFACLLADRDCITGFVENQESTSPGIFLGGKFAGMDQMQGVAFGGEVSKYIESFIQTGSPSRSESDSEIKKELHYVDHEGEVSVSRVNPSQLTDDGENVYSAEEAIAEASRCMACDCRKCLDSCEMLNSFKKRPQKIALEAFMDTKSNPPFSSCSLTREAYSCNICGHCKTVCPVDIDMGEVFQLARVGRAETGKHPTAFHDFWLRDFAFHNENSSYVRPENQDAQEKYIFFPGCKTADTNPTLIHNATAYLKEKFGAGLLLDCCGAPAFWAGEKKLFEEHILKIKTLWTGHGNPTFVFACAYCIKLFKEYLPEINLISIYEIMAKDEDFHIESPTEPMAVFDPCVSEGEENLQQSVRSLATNSELVISDLPGPNRCCGFGGHMRTANQELYDQLVSNRASEDERPYLVYCANCAEALRLDGKKCSHILELAFTDGFETSLPDLQEKQSNFIKAKALVLDMYNIPYQNNKEVFPWEKISLTIPPDVLKYMTSKLIMENDIKEAIWTAEGNGTIFINDDEGSRQCSLVKPRVTYWAEYKKHTGDDNETAHYELLSAYCHRMRFSEEA